MFGIHVHGPRLMPRIRIGRRRRVNVHHYHHAAPKAAPTQAERHQAALARLDREMAKAGIRYAEGGGVEYIPGHRKAPKDTAKAAAKGPESPAKYSDRR